MTDTISLTYSTTTVYLHNFTRSPPVYVTPTDLGIETGAEVIPLVGGRYDVNIPVDTTTDPDTPIDSFAPVFVGYTQDSTLHASLKAFRNLRLTLAVGTVSYTNMMIIGRLGWKIVGQNSAGFWYEFTVNLIQVVAPSA